jgi:hypothetical protein
VAQNLGAALAPPSAASSGSNAKAPGSAGGYLLPPSVLRDLDRGVRAKHRLFHHRFLHDCSMLFSTFRRLKKLLFAGASHIDRSLD